MPAIPSQLYLPTGNYGGNLLVNGDFESWSSGVTSSPDGWTLTGAGGTIARDTSNVQRGLASVKVTAALNTATDLAQSITISASQNTQLLGRSVTFSAQILASSVPWRVFLMLDDGVSTADSFFHTGEGSFIELSVTLRIDSAATKIEASLEINSGASISPTFDSAILVEGTIQTAFSQNIFDPFLKPRVVTATSNDTNATTSMVVIAGMSIANVILNGNQSVFLFFMTVCSNDTGPLNARFDARRGSTVISPPQGNNNNWPYQLDNVNYGQNNVATIVHLDDKPAAGIYTYDVRFLASAGITNVADRIFGLIIFPTP